MQTACHWIVLSLLLAVIGARSVVGISNEESIPEFFDESLNVYCLIIGFAIILLSIIIAFIIFRVKSREAAFEGSLFQNLDDDE